jgi:hypothetical protein
VLRHSLIVVDFGQLAAGPEILPPAHARYNEGRVVVTGFTCNGCYHADVFACLTHRCCDALSLVCAGWCGDMGIAISPGATLQTAPLHM